MNGHDKVVFVVDKNALVKLGRPEYQVPQFDGEPGIPRSRRLLEAVTVLEASSMVFLLEESRALVDEH